ncbi:HAD hydrolase-like protein [Aurantimicrobium sp. MWH-Uga1]|uniref:HAD hydrolase-like protein n=1 Tax=Aurantimicrobium sp. MWH-Uga1 TaxID=2079575 RepID=UPI000DED57BD|nr:HAD hydrolase-like protein [Aurantimicrobium sp. MWH-Uga1]AXE53750.1 5'-nucleotidase [Aurantimicrobium sp. MWH-Uga1]
MTTFEVDYTPGPVISTTGPWAPLLWDMDGTLLDSEVAIVRRLTEVLLHFGVTPPPADQLRYLIGPPTGTSLQRFIAPEHLDESRAYYRSLAERDGLTDQHLFPWILSTLKTFHDAGFPMAVATSKPQHEAERLCEAYGMAEYFSAIVGGSEKRLDKAAVIAEALQQLGNHNAVMIGDRFYDTDGAAHNGIPTILVRWGYAHEKEFAGAMAAVSNAEELVNLLLHNNEVA